MAVGAYVMRDAPPPPELTTALNYRSWGIGDIMTLPAGMLPRMNTVLSYHDAMVSYNRAKSQHQVKEWGKANPQAWNLVSWYLAERMKRE